MTRRTTPQAKVDEAAFPVRLLLQVPEMGFGRLMAPIHHWLDCELGRDNYAFHGAGRRVTGDSVAVYFRHPSAAGALLAAFPTLELADGVAS